MKRTVSLASLLVLSLGLALLPATVSAVEPGQRLSADEARASFLVTVPQSQCFTLDVWLSVLVGDVMPLGQGGRPGGFSQVYASDVVRDTCAGTEEFFDGAVALEPGQLEYVRLDSFAIHNVNLELVSPLGYRQRFTLDLNWSGTSDLMHGSYGLGGRVFQVEQWVTADVNGTVRVSDDWYFPGEPWPGEIAHLTQIGRPTP